MHRFPSALCAFLLLSGTLLFAKGKAKPGPTIVAHLPSEAVEAPRMTLRSEQGWDILYVQTSPQGALTVIDVSKANKPVVTRKVSAESAAMKPIGGSLAFVDDTHAKSAPAVPATEHKLRFMDTSDPANPHPIPELAGATSYAVDRVRGLLFLSNAAGLWVVHDDGLVDPSVKMWEDFVKAP